MDSACVLVNSFLPLEVLRIDFLRHKSSQRLPTKSAVWAHSERALFEENTNEDLKRSSSREPLGN